MLSLLECLGMINQMDNTVTYKNHIASCLVRQHAISQLIAHQYWGHAVYVAMQIQDGRRRTSAVRFIIDTWAGNDLLSYFFSLFLWAIVFDLIQLVVILHHTLYTGQEEWDDMEGKCKNMCSRLEVS